MQTDAETLARAAYRLAKQFTGLSHALLDKGSGGEVKTSPGAARSQAPCNTSMLAFKIVQETYLQEICGDAFSRLNPPSIAPLDGEQLATTLGRRAGEVAALDFADDILDLVRDLTARIEKRLNPPCIVDTAARPEARHEAWLIRAKLKKLGFDQPSDMDLRNWVRRGHITAEKSPHSNRNRYLLTEVIEYMLTQ